MFCAIQTLDQFEKNELTKYLKGVILGCANIFVFGRSSLSDMEVFSALAGVADKPDEQKTVSETALSDDSPSLSYSSREMWTQKNTLEGIDIRMNDFQVVTLFTIRDGAPCPPIKVKVHFLKKSDWGYESVNTADTLIRAKDDADNMKVALLSQYKNQDLKATDLPPLKVLKIKLRRTVRSIRLTKTNLFLICLIEVTCNNG